MFIKRSVYGLPVTPFVSLLSAELTRVSLNTSNINYGSGSGQQVVTAGGAGDDYNTIWTVKEAERLEETSPCKTGQPIRCGD